MSTRILAALVAAFLLGQSLVGQAQAQFIPPPPPITPPIVVPVPVLPPIVTGTAMTATVKTGAVFADGIYQTVGTINWPKATVRAGTVLTYVLGDIFELPTSQTLESCALTTAASAQSLSGNAYTGSYVVSGMSSAIVTVAGAGTHARKTSSSAAGGAAGIGSKSSTVSFAMSAPGIYLLSMNLGTISSDAACPWGTFTSTATGSASAATAVIQVVSSDDYAQPETGWYWEPSQGGRGVAIEYYPATKRIFMGVFGYGASGESSWLVGACAYDAATKSCTGSLDSYKGGATINQKDGPVAQMTGSVGNFTLTFNDRSRPTLSWIGPTLNLIRYGLSGAATAANALTGAFPNGAALQNGWYWDPALGGRGWFVETSRKPDGTVITFTVSFMYRADGSPVWYMYEATSTAQSAPVLFEAASKEVAGGASMTSQTWSSPDWSSVADRGQTNLALTGSAATITFAAGRIGLSKFEQ